MSSAEEKVAASKSAFRLRFGLWGAAILLAILAVHLAGRIKFDNPALGLIAGVAAALAFGMSDRLGIVKIGAGGASVELERAKEAAQAIPEKVPGELDKVINRYKELFPILGARVLWVDDAPEELIPHRQVLRRLGIQVVSVTSTDSAIAEVTRDPDFALLIQDRLRMRGTDDAKKLAAWVSQVGRQKYQLLAPLVVYSFDEFDASVGVITGDWITGDFGILLERVILEMRNWSSRIPELKSKSPKVAVG